MNSIVQITLKSILVIENGTADAGVEGVNALTATLIAPNEIKASVTSARSLKLKDKIETDFSQEDFKDQLLFKERILGDCILEVEITAIEKVTKLEKFFLKVFPSVVSVAIKAIPGLGTIVSSVVGTVTSSLFNGIDPHDKITIIGQGSMPLSAMNTEGKLIVNLTVPKDVVLNSTPFFNDEGDEMIRRITLKEDLVNANVVFMIQDITPPSGPLPAAGTIS